MIIRFAEIKDLPVLVRIYNQAIKSKSATGDTEELSLENRVKWFNKFDTNTYPLYVIETKNTVVGYCSISPYRPGRQAMFSVAEISYYIDYSYHHQGFGTALLEYVISDCPRIGKENILAITLDINKPSLDILKKFHFKEWGHFPNIIKIDGNRCGHYIYGLQINKTK